MADTVLPHARRLKQTNELGKLSFYQTLDLTYDGSRLSGRLNTGTLAHDGHKLLGVHIPNHIYRSVLRCTAAVVLALSVIALALHKRLCVDVTTQMNAVAVRDACEPERKLQGAYRAVPCLKYLMLPRQVGRCLGILAYGDKCALLAEQPVLVSGVLNHLDVDCLSPRFSI